MPKSELVKHLRAYQCRLLAQNAETSAQEIAARSALRFPGAICPPHAEYADPFDRVNVLLFWHMAHLLEAMASVLREGDEELARISDVTLADHMQLAYTSGNVRSNPLFEALTRACAARGGGGGGLTECYVARAPARSRP